MTIEIPEDLVRGLEDIAKSEEKSVEQVALERLRSLLDAPGSPKALLHALGELPPLSSDAIDELEAAIAADRRTVRDDGVFD